MNFEAAKEATKYRVAASQCRAAANAIREVLHGLYDEASYRTAVENANKALNDVAHLALFPETLSLKSAIWYEMVASQMEANAFGVVLANMD